MLSHTQLSKDIDSDWLKARTLHIKGIPREDRTGNGLKMVLDKHLEQTGGKVLAIQIVPPFSKMFQIESKIRDLKYFRMLIDSGEADNSFFCCVPRDL